MFHFDFLKLYIENNQGNNYLSDLRGIVNDKFNGLS